MLHRVKILKRHCIAIINVCQINKFKKKLENIVYDIIFVYCPFYYHVDIV